MTNVVHSSAKHPQGHAFAARLAVRLGLNKFSWATHDGRFVKNLDASRIDQAMVKVMNKIADALGKKTIAEFAENEQSFKMFAAFGIDYAQACYLGRPDVALAALCPLKNAAARKIS